MHTRCKEGFSPSSSFVNRHNSLAPTMHSARALNSPRTYPPWLITLVQILSDNDEAKIDIPYLEGALTSVEASGQWDRPRAKHSGSYVHQPETPAARLCRTVKKAGRNARSIQMF